MTGRNQSNPLFELTLAVADWKSAKKLDKARDEINAAIAQTLAGLNPDEVDDIVFRPPGWCGNNSKHGERSSSRGEFVRVNAAGSASRQRFVNMAMSW